METHQSYWLPSEESEIEENRGGSIVEDQDTLSVEEADNKSRIAEILSGLAEILNEVFENEGKDSSETNITVSAVLDVFMALQYLHRVPVPDFMYLLGGGIGVEWLNEKKNKTFVANFRGNSKIVYAGLLGGDDKLHGSVPLQETKIKKLEYLVDDALNESI